MEKNNIRARLRLSDTNPSSNTFQWPMDKSPGPNKVAAHVLKDCLDVILGPLPDIVNCSILTSSFPAKWKAEVIPILKDGDHEVAANNRPISLPIASKVCETIVLDQIISYITENKLLPSHQSRNKKSHLTETLNILVTRQHPSSHEWQKNNCACALRPFQGLWQYKPWKTIGKTFNRWCLAFYCWMVQELFIKPLPVCQNQFHSFWLSTCYPWCNSSSRCNPVAITVLHLFECLTIDKDLLPNWVLCGRFKAIFMIST